MPTYEYSCYSCEHRFDAAYKIADRLKPESEPCPACGELEVKKGIFTADAVLKFNDSKDQGQFKEMISNMKKNTRGNTLPDY